jgi:hypothetical protein
MQTYENPDLKNEVAKDNALKEFIVNYVGNKLKPEDGSITTEMVVEVMSKEFPEFVLALAEENFIRGYEQALTDVESELPQKKTKKKKK